MKKVLITLVVLFSILTFSYSQSVVLTSGSIDFVKEAPVLQFTFSYNEMLVGKLTESEYVNKKITDYNEKEAGKGDE